MAEAVALSAVEKIGGWLIEPIQRELGYLFCFNNNFQDLQIRLDELKATRDDVYAREDEAQRSWKTLGGAAKKWMVDAKGKIEEAENVNVHKIELQKGCFSIQWCPNLKLRFSLGRKAKKLSLLLHDLLQSGRPYLSQTVLDIPLPPANMRHDNEDDTDFDSRVKPMEEIMKLLQDKETKLIGICGMAGIGKTTFATQVLQKVQDLHLFDFQFMLTVSRNPNFSTLQQQALKKLGFNPSSTVIVDVDEKETAQLLRSAFDKKKVDKKKVVFVLDDVWEEFDLSAKGFPLSKSDVEGFCKIIYTSRSQGLWIGQKTIKKEEIHLDLLSHKESLDLFIREANLNNDDDDFREKNIIARKIVDECKGLPLALKVAGSALIERRIYEWNNMLSNFQNHDQHVDKIKMVLETSYHFLEDPNLKLLFLLCCLFQEDQEIPIETLYRYAVGLQLFKGIKDFENLRNRVYTLVDVLIRRSLLINVEALDHPDNLIIKRILLTNIKVLDFGDEGRERAVKMHDVVRDVGILIARTHENGFSFLTYKRANDLDNSFGQHTKMVSILFQDLPSKVFLQLCDVMEFRGSKLELQLLRLDMDKNNYIIMSKDFFQGMDHLKVLVIDGNICIPSKLSSFSYLANLKMLSLENLNLRNLSTIRHLNFLEILSFRCSSMAVLPNEISELTNLRLLDLTACKCFIRNGVLSKLTNLQELYMWHGFKDWRVPREKSLSNITNKDNNVAADFIELNHLNKLRRLEFQVFNLEQLPRNINLLPSSKLLKFKIGIGGKGGERERVREREKEKEGKREIKIEKEIFFDDEDDDDHDDEDEIYLRGERVICLTNVDENVFHAFEVIMENNLTDIVLEDCESILTLSSLVKLSPQTSNIELGGYLRRVQIFRCKQMKYLNDYSDAKEHKKIESNYLESVILDDLCSLECFYKGKNEIYFPKLRRLELVKLELFILPTKLEMPQLEKLIIESIPHLENLCNFRVPSIKELTICDCPNFKYVFSSASSSMMENIFHLSSLRVKRCSSLKGILSVSIGARENWNKLFEFSNLRELELMSLCELASFVIDEEEKLQTSLFYHDEVSFPRLIKLVIRELSKINYIVGWNGLQQRRGYHRVNDNKQKIQQHILFPILYGLLLDKLNNLIHIYENNPQKLEAGVLLFQKLSQLIIRDCAQLRYLFSENIGRVLGKHLESLYIFKCPIMEVVMKKDDDAYDDKTVGGEESNYDPNSHFFPLLEMLILKNLPELNRFCDVVYTWVLPSLYSLYVASCPKLEALSLGCLNSPELDTFIYNDRLKNEEGDINNTLRHLFNKVDDSEDGVDDDEVDGVDDEDGVDDC